MGTAKWRIIAAIRWKHGGSEECLLVRDGRQSLASCSDDYYVVARAACTSTMFAIRLLTASLEFLLVMGCGPFDDRASPLRTGTLSLLL